MVEVPLLGELTRDEFDDWLQSKPIAVAALGGGMFEFVLEEYEDDEAPHEFHEAIRCFLSIDESVLKVAQGEIYRYYQAITAHLTPDEDGYIDIACPEDIWRHIQFVGDPTVSRRTYGDKAVYISLTCACDWEQEHGLQIVFKQGRYVNKIGPFDGHLSNADAYADEALEDVVYR